MDAVIRLVDQYKFVSSFAVNPATNQAEILLPPTGLHVQKG
jgi:hypothetical protein